MQMLQIVSLCAYLSGNWRRYLLVVNIGSLPVLLLMLSWLESPRWLIQKRRHNEAVANFNKISKWNHCRTRFTSSDLMHIKVNANERM